MNRIAQITVAAVILAVSLAFCQIYHHDVNLVTTSPWAENSWHQIGPNCTVEDGTLLIGDNVLVEFYEDQSINVLGGGTIDATDGGGNPIVFRSLGDVQVPGYWHALIAQGTSENPATMTLTNCEIRYGGESMSEWLAVDGVIQGVQYSEMLIDNCYIHNNLGSGVGTNHATYNHVHMHDCHVDSCEAGLKLLTVDQLSSEIKRNLITNCDVGMRLYTGNGAPIFNNIIYASADTGVAVVGLTDNFKNNVVDGGDDVGIYLYVDISYSIIENNIIVNNDGYGMAQESGSGDVEYCDVWNNAGGNYHNLSGGTGSISSDPIFVGIVGNNPYDYHLQWDSPCLGAGTGTNNNPATSTADMGAYGGPELEPDSKAPLSSLYKP